MSQNLKFTEIGILGLLNFMMAKLEEMNELRRP